MPEPKTTLVRASVIKGTLYKTAGMLAVGGVSEKRERKTVVRHTYDVTVEIDKLQWFAVNHLSGRAVRNTSAY